MAQSVTLNLKFHLTILLVKCTMVNELNVSLISVSEVMILIAVLLVYCTIAVGIDPESGGLVQRLISQREELVQVCS